MSYISLYYDVISRLGPLIIEVMYYWYIEGAVFNEVLPFITVFSLLFSVSDGLNRMDGFKRCRVRSSGWLGREGIGVLWYNIWYTLSLVLALQSTSLFILVLLYHFPTFQCLVIVWCELVGLPHHGLSVSLKCTVNIIARYFVLVMIFNTSEWS